ncbi:MAG: CRISPR-associated CARF protein Csa3 [Candidatus Nezhaarchaeales archaeon]
MSRLFISTLGFDEAFSIRFLMRNQPRPGDVVLVVSPLPDDARSMSAYQQLETFLTKYLSGVELKKIHVPVDKVYQAIAIIAQAIKSLKISNVIVNLSGGMRILVLEVLAAVKMVFDDSADIEVELEDKRSVVRLKPSIMDLRMPSDRQICILRAMKELGREVSLKRIEDKTGIPRSSVYKEITKMEEEGFVTRIGGRFTLTDLGYVWAQE